MSTEVVAFEPLLEELARARLDPADVLATIDAALAEDLPGGSVDVTTAATIPAEAVGEGVFAARQPGVVAGLGVAALVFLRVDPRVEVHDRLADGSRVAAGDVVMRVGGPTRSLLTAE